MPTAIPEGAIFHHNGGDNSCKLHQIMAGDERMRQGLPQPVLDDGVDTESGLVGLMNFITEPAEKDWARVLHYSVRIRELRLVEIGLIPCSRLLPNLERLACHDNVYNPLYFVQPTLKTLTIFNLSNFADILAEKIKEPGISICELELLDENIRSKEEDSVNSMIFVALDQLTSLTHLGGPLADDVMEHLASSSRLVRITLYLYDVDYARDRYCSNLAPAPSDFAFCNLFGHFASQASSSSSPLPTSKS
ncbi:hypothetical protein PHLGIDRAFT_15182 [Phlebiopsis gigantea 11061_1 CR5-6]|uniref:Uncharacterized protein n=1 Tax=Phlebiopsis gigantea (strain 11061_1 CR5-6) TaxID=745531 RepID=A0A0C3S736_PHLG1|nr:hypothetical protein PHLGIDRAFT_15182 [Phlebiopsis gigantea 11061_1 CR5-6]